MLLLPFFVLHIDVVTLANLEGYRRHRGGPRQVCVLARRFLRDRIEVVLLGHPRDVLVASSRI